MISKRKTIVHICRDFEYRGGVESFLFDFVKYNRKYDHIVIATEGVPGERSRKLKAQGVEIYYISGSFWLKVRRINQIVLKYDLPILHAHLFRPEKLGLFIRGCSAKITTKYATYATDSQGGDDLISRGLRFVDNSLIEYIVTCFYDNVFIISNELYSKWKHLSHRIQRVALSTVKTFVDGRVKMSQKWSFKIEPLGRGIGDPFLIPNFPFRVKWI